MDILGFDTAKFGDAINLSNNALNLLNVSPIKISTWQKEDIANNVVERSRYYKNPMTTVCATIKASASLIYNIANNDPANTFTNAANVAPALIASANNLIIEVDRFKLHTDNISGLERSISTEESFNYPDLDSVTSLGTQMLLITNATDGVKDATPMLGCMTSLFIKDEMDANNANVGNAYFTLASSIDIGGNCNITVSEVNTIITIIDSASNLMNVRRTGDTIFYQNSKKILEDYSFLNRFNSLGNTQLYLINNLIGTETLINNLANT